MARGTREEFNGVVFLSKLEARIARQLHEAGVEYDYEKWSIDYDLPITKAVCNACSSNDIVGERSYTPDFFLPKQGIYIEAKGHFKPHGRKIMQIIQREVDIDIRMVFLRDNILRKGSNNTYVGWCEQRGIPCAVGSVPEEWIK